MKPLNIAWMLEDTHVGGGARVVLAQADALVARGHRATIVTRGPAVRWRSSRAEWQHVRDWSEADVAAFDFVVATFWTTIAPALALAGRRVIHLCQGYEGAFEAYADIKPQIDKAYRLPAPKITVSPHLVDICRTFHPDVTYIGQIVDEEFFAEPRFRAMARPRVLAVGPMLKGLGIVYDAVAAAKRRGLDCDLVRVSPTPAESGEPSGSAAEYHVAVPTAEMARIIASCDVALCPADSAEGFGLPAAEAMAGGVPVVLTRTPSYLSFDPHRDYAIFADEGDPASIADGLVRLCSDEMLRRHTALRGRQVVEQFRTAIVGDRLERYFWERRAR